MDFQSEKRLVRDYYAALDSAEGPMIEDVMTRFVADDYIWRGYHPFHEQTSGQDVARVFWQPFRQAFTRMQRRMDIFIAGKNEMDGFQSTWVISMGHLMGIFKKPWLGIPPTGKIGIMRYCEFNKLEDGKITETAMFFDIPMVMMQAGLQPFPPQTGTHMVQPGPMTHTGLCFDPQDPLEGEKTLAAINFMIGDIRDWKDREPEGLEIELPRSWNDDMIWWGPAGIGASYTIDGYIRGHSGPFRDGLGDMTFNGHLCRLAEGEFGGFFGWPNLTILPEGGFMGMPATGKYSDMRVIDMYRRDGDKLTENWIFIDLLHFWNQQGVDILARTTKDAQP
ncbi:ester cyclase [Phaeobacter sp. C3_T13_0]|uniref:nuclear transport factor 2 family protein n=1 Tax=Phaeobacter cretensis TaxID=3342641 RepID=UPI0039BCBDED